MICTFDNFVNEEKNFYNRKISTTDYDKIKLYKPLLTCGLSCDERVWNIANEYLNYNFILSKFSDGKFIDLDNVYQNHYDYMESFKNKENYNDYEYLEGDYKIGSRSTICGFMTKDNGIKLYDILKKNNNFVVCLSCYEYDDMYIDWTNITDTNYDNIIDYTHDEFQFKNGKPMYKEYIENEIIIKNHNLGLYDSDPVFKKLHQIHTRGFSGSLNNKDKFKNICSSMSPILRNFVEPDNVVELCIMDKRWNNNEELFNFFNESLKSLY